MRALCGAIIAAGSLIGLGLACLGVGNRYSNFHRDLEDSTVLFVRFKMLDTPLQFGLVFLAVRIRRRRLPRSRWFYRALTLAGPLSVIALIAGWVTTEVGRQPWVVYEVMLTRQAVTGASGIPVGYATLVAVYLLLASAVVWVLRQLARAPLGPVESQPETAGF